MKAIKAPGVPDLRETEIRLGIRENLWQFSLLVVVNAFVGAMVGLERTILPAIAEHDFHLAARHRSALLHCRIWCRQSTDQLLCRPSIRRLGTEGRPGDRLDHRCAGSIHADVGSLVELGARRQCVSRYKPRAHVVDDRDHENRLGWA